MHKTLDSLLEFKKHRNEISESLTNDFVGREKEINDICNILSEKGFIAITGQAGIGKSRLAVAAMERYVSINKNVRVLCVKNFCDYLSAIEEIIDDSMEYLFLFDDANNYKKLDEVIECLKYHNQGNVKAIFTIRDYLKDCIDFDLITPYEITPLSDKDIKKAIIDNTPIKNDEYLNKILNVSKGNIRIAFIVSDFVLKSGNGITSLFNVKDVMNNFYKKQMDKIGNTNNLVITAGIVSFFKSINLNQLFYISPILKIAGISKKEFLDNAQTLISMEFLDECVDIIKVSDQCFSDYLLNYVFIEKKYISIEDLIVNTYKYYNKRIIESLNAILSICLTEDTISYIKKEVINTISKIEDIELKHDLVVAFAPLALDYAAKEFKMGVEEYTDKKDIKWLLKLFQSLAKSEYSSVALEGIMRIMKKTNKKKSDVFNIINDTYILDYDSVKTSFRYLDSFLNYLIEYNINNENFLSLTSSYLKYFFNNSKFVNGKVIEFTSFNLSDDINGIIYFREKCWNYIFSYSSDKASDAIVDFAKYHITCGAKKIVLSDLKIINNYLDKCEDSELIYAILYEELKVDSKMYGFEDMLSRSEKYGDILSAILEKKPQDLNIETFKKLHNEKVFSFYSKYKRKIFEMIKDIDVIKKYYIYEIKSFLLIVLDCLDEFSQDILNIFIQYKVNPKLVVKKASLIVGLDYLYEMIKSIEDDNVREEYFYNFYSLINCHDSNNLYNFDAWVKSKQMLKIESYIERSALSLRKIAENSGISYVELVKIIFKKRVYNEIIVMEYFSYLLTDHDCFKELLDLNQELAIKIYEFLISNRVCDYENKALKEIIKVKRNYIKSFAKRYINNSIFDEEGIDEIIFDGDNYKMFFNTCLKIVKEKPQHFVPLHLQQFISNHLVNQNIYDWIITYIDENWKDNIIMESLFSILAGINDNYKNQFIVKYYNLGKDENVLKCALVGQSTFYSFNSFESYFNNKIRNLESLKKELIEWDKLNLISFIDELIEKCKEEIRKSKISQLIEHVDSSILEELQEIDLKTEVSLNDALKLYCDDENFRNMLSSGYFSYNDGSFSTNDNVPLKFTDVLKDKKIIGIKVVPVKEDVQDKYEEYLSSMNMIINRFGHSNNVTLCECLTQLFNERGWDVADFECETYLSRDIFSKIKNNKKNKFEKITIIKILIGLKLSKKERDFLLELNGTQLSIYNETDALYDFILNAKVDIETADELLRDVGKEGF